MSIFIEAHSGHSPEPTSLRILALEEGMAAEGWVSDRITAKKGSKRLVFMVEEVSITVERVEN